MLRRLFFITAMLTVLAFVPVAMNTLAAEECERTLSIIKPDAVSARHIGEMLARFEKNGLHIAAMKMVQLNSEQAERFYAVHSERPFFSELVDYMSSGPIVALVLEGDNAIVKTREIMGATDPKKAAAGTLRAEYATSVGQNAVHGSDCSENALIEISFFFDPTEIY